MVRTLKALFGDKAGVTALEYGVIAAIIVVAVATTIGTVGNKLSATFVNIANSL